MRPSKKTNVRFIQTHPDGNRVTIQIPAEIHASFSRFHQQAGKYSEHYEFTPCDTKTFSYRWNVPLESPARLNYVRARHSVWLQAYFGPKAIEIIALCSPETQQETISLIDDLFKKLPVTEIGEKKTCPVNDAKTIITWYRAHRDQYPELEHVINLTLAGKKL